MIKRFAGVVVLLLVARALGAADGPLTVGTASAAPGQKAYGAIEVPAGVDAGTRIAAAVVRGAKAGPTLAIVSGAHGTEYASIVAVSKLVQQLDPAQLSGSVILVPLVNVASFEQKVPHVNPVDGKSMNRFYPGKADGTQTERALLAMTREVVDKCDYLIDLHGGDLDEDLRPYSYWVRSGDARLDERTKPLALAFGLEDIVVLDLDVSQPAGRRSLSGYALSLGKLSIVAEAGRSGVSSPEDVGALVEGCFNMMAALKMIDRAVTPVPHPAWIADDVRVAADGPGMFFQTVGHGDYVMAGAKVGFTTDYVGRATGDVLSPVTGVVTFIRGVPSVWKGAALVNVGVAYAEPPPYRKPAQ